jgi:hypothetical protein
MKAAVLAETNRLARKTVRLPSAGAALGGTAEKTAEWNGGE